MEVHRQHFLLIWKHREESVEKFVNKLNSFHLTIEFTAEYSKETIHKIGRREFIKSNFFFVKPTDSVFRSKLPSYFITAKKEYHIVKF